MLEGLLTIVIALADSIVQPLPPDPPVVQCQYGQDCYPIDPNPCKPWMECE